MDEFITSENTQEVAAPVENVESINTTQELGEQPEQSAETVEVAEQPQEEKQVQTKEENAKWATKRREQEAREKELSQKAIDDYISSKGYTWNGRPIKTEAEYNQALREQEIYNKAKEEGKDPQEALRISQLEERQRQTDEQLARYELKERCYQQDEQLSNDPKLGEIYKEWRNDVKEFSSQFNVDYDTAFTILTRERLADILGKAKTQTQQEVIQKINSNGQSSPGSLGSETSNNKMSFSKMSSKDFKEFQERVLRGEIKD